VSFNKSSENFGTHRVYTNINMYIHLLIIKDRRIKAWLNASTRRDAIVQRLRQLGTREVVFYWHWPPITRCILPLVINKAG